MIESFTFFFSWPKLHEFAWLIQHILDFIIQTEFDRAK